MDCKEKPGSGWDWALLGVAIAASLPFIAANIVVLLHRKRSYFRAQGGAPLILASSIAGLIWITAAFVANFHFPRNHPLLRNCPLWSFWLMITFGVWLWLACQITRLLHLHFLCQNATSADSAKRRTLLCFLFLWTPGLAYGIVANDTHASHSRNGDDPCANCDLVAAWKDCTFIILPLVYFIIVVIVLFRSKNNKDYMMAVECSHTSEYSFIMVLVIHLLYGATFITKSQKNIAGRCFLTFCVCFVIFINFWVRLGRPVYLCVWKGEAGIDSFEEELRCNGAHCLDKLSSARGTSRGTGRSSSSLQYGDWILRAIDAAMSEASDCKERINQLEQRKAALSAKIEHLGSSTSAKYMSSSASARGL